MIGIVTSFQKYGFVEIHTDIFISIIELLGGYKVEIGDEIKGNLYSLGGEEVYNISKEEETNIFIQSISKRLSVTKHR